MENKINNMNNLRDNALKGIILVIIFGVIFLMLGDGKYVLFPKEKTNDYVESGA